MSCETLCCSSAMTTRFIKPRSPCLAGNVKNSRNSLPGGDCPVSPGMKMGLNCSL